MTPIEAIAAYGHAWLRPMESMIPSGRDPSHLVAIGPARDLHVSVTIDATIFELNHEAPMLPSDNFKLGLTATVGAGHAPLQLVEGVVTVVDQTAKSARPEQPSKATRIMQRFKQGDGDATLAWKEAPDPEHDYTLELTITSAAGAVVTASITGVRVASTLTRRVWVRTTLAYLSIVLFAGLLTSLLRAIARPAARWGMLTASTTSGALGAVAQASFLPSLGVHMLALAIALLATLAGLVGIGLLEPRAFNAISEHEPFNAMSHYAFYLRWFRERYVAEYLNRLTRTIGMLRANAFHEDYVRVPATLHSANDSESRQPDLDLARLLTDCNHVLIEAPGGMGKSALLRAVVRELAKARYGHPDLPIPLLCESTLPATTAEIADRLFEKGELSTKALQVLSTNLTYVVVFDGLAESNVPPSALDRLAYAPHGAPRRVHLLVSTRPHPQYALTLANCGPTTTVALHRISEQAVRRFEHACATSLAIALRKPAPEGDETRGILSDSMRSHCIDRDGKYIPVLIKLAVVVQRDVPSVSELYRLTLAWLLKLDPSDQAFGQQIIDAGKLCAATYWREGLRSMAFAGAPPQHRAILRTLKDMSVVYSTETSNHPREVRFFHDSMQSYLTAVALTTGAVDFEFLARAAGNARFREGDVGAELFRMCVDLIPADQVSGYIDATLTQWRALFAGELAPNAVARAIPDALKSPIVPALPDAAPMSADRLLREALALAQRSPTSDFARQVLFEGVAPLCWPLINRRYVDISTDPPGGQLVIDDVEVGAAPLSHPCDVGKQLVVTATLDQNGRHLRGSSVATVQRDPATARNHSASLTCHI